MDAPLYIGEPLIDLISVTVHDAALPGARAERSIALLTLCPHSLSLAWTVIAMGLTSRLTGAVTGQSPHHQDKSHSSGSQDKAPEGAAADDTESVSGQSIVPVYSCLPCEIGRSLTEFLAVSLGDQSVERQSKDTRVLMPGCSDPTECWTMNPRTVSCSVPASGDQCTCVHARNEGMFNFAVDLTGGDNLGLPLAAGTALHAWMASG